MEFLTLREGPTLPIAAIELAIDLELRGCCLHRSAGKLIVTGAQLSDEDRNQIRQFKLHLIELAAYCERQ